jgi:heme-degrading monooxygenase HmoA
MKQQPIFEIAVRKVKDGRKFDFVTERSNFVKSLTTQPGVGNDREFQSFYALPEPDKREVFIGMTEYESQEALHQVQQKMYSAFAPFAETMDLKAYAFVKQTEGPEFDLATVAARQGQILEVGVRKVHAGKEEAFNRYRKEFVELLSSYDGVLDSYEFAVVAGQDTENLTVGMTVYENQSALMNLIPDIMQKEITQKYFGTFDVVASQFAFSTTNKKSPMVQEIAIRKVKPGQEEAFKAARSLFIKQLKEQAGIEKDWEFKSFFTMPEPDDTDVFVGMTRYESSEAMQKIAGKLMNTPAAADFFSTFDMKSFVAVQAEDGGYFKLEDHIKEGNVLEVAVRSPKAGMEDKFTQARKEFFDLIAQQDGYLFDKELVDLQTGDKVVLIGWRSMDDFQKALGTLQTKPEMGAFFGILDVRAYQALTFSSNR